MYAGANWRAHLRRNRSEMGQESCSVLEAALVARELNVKRGVVTRPLVVRNL